MKYRNTCYCRLALFLLMGLLPALTAMADEVVVADVNGNQLSYTYDEADGPATFTGIKAYSADEAKAGRIVIADRITDGEGRGHDVLYVSGSVSNRQKLVSIVFGKNIIATGGPDGQQDDAFYNCKQLESVTLNSKLEILGRYTFQYCNNLVDINLAEATSLRKMMYRSMQSTGIRELTVPVSVREFDDVFPGCDSVRTLTFLADSVPAYFFRSSRHLETINIGPGVKYIGTEAFSGNRYMTSLNISSDVSGLVIGENAFANSDRLPSVSLPVGVSELQYGAFYDCDSLRTFTFADGSPIKEIPQLCFYYCVSLESITLPDAVETLGPSAFYQCRSLREINFGTGLTTLPDDSWYIFSGCDQLKKVVLPCANYPFTNNVWFPSDVLLYVHPDLVDTYRTNEFTSNYHIIANGQSTDFVVTTTAGGQLQTRVEEIGPAYNVMNLTVAGPVNGTDIDYLHTLPNIEVLNMKEASIVAGGDSYHQWDVEQSGKATVNPYYGPWNTEDNVISRCMFYNMPRLRSLSLPKGATKIGEWAVGQDRNHSLRLKHVELPEGITEIGRYAFEWTGIETLTVPAGVTRLEENTFANCRNLKKAVLPDGITFIGNSCFSECQSMEDVNIPAQIETIENDAFYGNAVRTAPILFPSTLKTIGYNAFAYNRMVKNITFSEGLEAIRGSAFSNCNAVESIKLPESLTTLEGNAFEGCDSLTEFVFPASITEVPNYILYHCDKLQKVLLAAGTTSIAYGAFSQCPQLSDINISDMNTLGFVGAYAFENTGFTTMTLPNSITQMDYSTFHSCKQLTSINVPTGIDYVPANFCENCEQLASVTMHDGIRTIRHTAFYGCPTLAAVDLNDKITSIEYNAFRGCASLQLDKLPDSLTYIGSSAFYQCQSLTGALAIPAGVTVIESDAFNTTAITAATLPEGITQMGSGVFAHCKQLATVTLPTDMTRIESYTFQECTSLEQIQIPDGLREVGYGAFDQSGLASITLPDSLSVIESYAFSSTQLREFRVPDGLHGDPGSWTWAYCKQLKTIYLGRNQDYSLLTDFTCLYGCDSLQLLRIYSATPPRCYSYYLNYRQNCVLEVPEDQVELYRQADVWKEFKEVRGFFDGDVLNDLDFAVMQKMYRQLDGAHWKQPWDLTNNHRSMGKWHGVTTVGDYITAIDLSSQGLKGELCDSLFMLSRLETVNLSDNNITGDLGTLLDKMPVNDHVTEVNMKGNALTGDIYPFAIKLPNLERLDLSYNQLTEVSQPIPNDRLANNQFARGFQFVSWQTKQVVDGAPIVDVRPGHAVAIESNTLQTYRHEYGDYGFTFSSLARLQPRSDNNWDYYWELTKDDDNQWNVYKNDWNNYVLHVQKGVPTAYTHANPWWSFLTYILRFDWTDGDVNCDDAVDVADLQSVVYYALNDGKANGMPFNYTTADVNSDNAINVSDIVGSVDYIMSYEEQPTNAREHIYNRAAADVRNLVSHDGTSVVLTNTDVVAALQLTISGATARQLRISDDVRSRFTVAVRDVAGGVRVVVYSPEGRTLAAGMHSLLTGMPAGASITDVRLADSQARYLDVALDGTTTSLSAVRTLLQTPDAVVYDLSGRRMGSLDSLPEGIYLINVNGKQYKVAIK